MKQTDIYGNHASLPSSLIRPWPSQEKKREHRMDLTVFSLCRWGDLHPAHIAKLQIKTLASILLDVRAAGTSIRAVQDLLRQPESWTTAGHCQAAAARVKKHVRPQLHEAPQVLLSWWQGSGRQRAESVPRWQGKGNGGGKEGRRLSAANMPTRTYPSFFSPPTEKLLAWGVSINKNLLPFIWLLISHLPFSVIGGLHWHQWWGR